MAIWGILFLALSIAGAVVLILGKDKIYMGIAGATAVIALIAIIQLIRGVAESEGLGHLGIGFFFLLAGAVLMVVGAVMKVRKGNN